MIVRRIGASLSGRIAERLLTADDIQAAPILAGREGEDVCALPSSRSGRGGRGWPSSGEAYGGDGRGRIPRPG